MSFETYEIISVIQVYSDIFFIRLKPLGKKHISAFVPGQFYHMKNPHYSNPNETRQFSVITTFTTKTYLEFCIKIYGPWTKALLKKKPGETILLFGPMGQFTFRKTTHDLVFLAGGVGIAPVFSIITSLHEKNVHNPLTLIYANKSSQDILKKAHLKRLFQKKPAWKLIFLVTQCESQVKNEQNGYIDDTLLKKEVAMENKPVFYICGSSRFTQNITLLLKDLAVRDSHIKKEVFLPPYPLKTNKTDQ